jgi:hypothetical protein
VAHEVWHVVVLASTLLGASAAAILLLSSIVFDAIPAGLRRARPAVLALIVGAAIILLAEWFVVH